MAGCTKRLEVRRIEAALRGAADRHDVIDDPRGDDAPRGPAFAAGRLRDEMLGAQHVPGVVITALPRSRSRIVAVILGPERSEALRGRGYPGSPEDRQAGIAHGVNS